MIKLLILSQLLIFANFAPAQAVVPQGLAEGIAVKKAEAEWGDVSLGQVIPYYDFESELSAYAFVFTTDGGGFPYEAEIASEVREARSLMEEAISKGDRELYWQAQDQHWGVGSYATVVVSARYDLVPIPELCNCLPRYFTTLDRAEEKAREELRTSPKFVKVIYLAPQDEWFEFKAGGQRVFIHAYSLEPLRLEPTVTLSKTPEISAQMREALAPKWQRVAQTAHFSTVDSGYVDSVPFCLWSYGCTPTASAMIMWYWDPRGYGRLTDYFFDRYDPPFGGDYDSDVPNVQQELAIGMHTDTMSGGTYLNWIAPGHLYVTNTVNGYSFGSVPYFDGGPGNGWHWNRIVQEIDAGRPFHWAVFKHYPRIPPPSGHSLCGVGYKVDAAGDSLVCVHNTWDTGEHWWQLYTTEWGYSTSHVITVIPGGENPNNIQLTFPEGNEVLPEGFKHRIQWESTGGGVDHLGIWYAPDSGGIDTLWQEIAPSVPDEGYYVWPIAEGDSLKGRINLVAYASNNSELAGDGSISKFQTVRLPHSPNILPSGYTDTPGDAKAVWNAGSVGYVADGWNGLVVLDLSDPSLPIPIGHWSTGNNNSQGISYLAPYLYLADGANGLWRLDVSDPANPVEVGRFPTTGDAGSVWVEEGYAYLCHGTNLSIIDVTDPDTLVEVANLQFQRQVYDVCVADGFAYLANLTHGVRVLDISDPRNPVEVRQIETQGSAVGVRYGPWWRHPDGCLYVAEGAKGVEVFDLADFSSLGVYDTPGFAQGLAVSGNYLFVADRTEGIRALDASSPSNPTEAGYFDTHGNAYGLFFSDSLISVADGSGGVYLLSTDLVGVEEPVAGVPISVSKINCAPNPFSKSICIRFQVALDGPVSLKLYDSSGRLVQTLIQGDMRAGQYEVSWLGDDDRGRTLPGGVYYCCLGTGGSLKVKKMVLLR